MAVKYTGKRVIIKHFAGELSNLETGFRIIRIIADKQERRIGGRERGPVLHGDAGERQGGDIRERKQG